MNNCFLTILIIILLVHSELISQNKYTNRGEKSYSVGIGLSRMKDITNVSLQYGFSDNGKIALGAFGNYISSQTRGGGFGFYFEGALIKPNENCIIGINILLSASINWYQTLHLSSNTYTGQAASFGGEFYIASQEVAIIPFVQFSRTYSKISRDNAPKSVPINGLGLGFDILLNSDSRPRAIITPGFLWTYQRNFIGAIDVSFILIRNPIIKKNK